MDLKPKRDGVVRHKGITVSHYHDGDSHQVFLAGRSGGLDWNASLAAAIDGTIEPQQVCGSESEVSVDLTQRQLTAIDEIFSAYCDADLY